MVRVKGQAIRVKLLLFSLALSAFGFQLSPVHAEPGHASFAQAEKLFLEGRYEHVIYRVDELIASGSRQVDELLFLKGLAQLKSNLFKDARVSFRRVISKFPKSKRAFDAHIGVGDSYFLGSDDIDAAISAYQDILNRYPNDKNIPVVYYRMGNCFKKIGSNDKAAEYFNKVKTLAPLSFESRMIPGFVSSKVPQAASKGHFSVQVGSFKNKRNAEKLVSKLSKEGFDSFMEIPVSSSDRLYRVKVGRLDSKKEAEVLASRLKARGYSTRICD